VNAEISGNSAERFANVLEEMSKSRMISFSDNGTFSAKTLPMRFTTNKQLLKNCFELASFAGDKSDLAILASGKDANNVTVDTNTIKTTAFRVERAAHNKMLDVEESSEELNMKAKRPKKPVITGLGTRIKAYKQRCHAAIGVTCKSNPTRLEFWSYKI
jgi:hypothetical protein